jgi:hypothetical protein
MVKRLLAGVLVVGLATAGLVLTGADSPVQAASGTLLGVHDAAAPGRLAKRYPGVEATREFVGGVQGTGVDLRAKYGAVAKPSWDAGLVPFVSIKTDPVKTGNGAYDSRFRDLARWLENKPDSYFVWYHEPEDNMTGPTFAKAFKRVRDVMKAANPKVKVGYAAMAYQWGSSQNRTKNPAPWRVTADFYGVDTYSGGTQPATAILSEHKPHTRWYDEVVRKTPGASTKWGLTERGFKGSADQQRAKVIERETAYLQGLSATTSVTRPSFYLYWNTKGTEGDADLINGPKAQAAVARLVKTS